VLFPPLFVDFDENSLRNSAGREYKQSLRVNIVVGENEKGD